MWARGSDRFEEWLRAPVALKSTDPRLEVRRALPSEFDAIYDLLDEVLGTKRSRAFNNWLYRRNPEGTARCWIVAEKSSGKLVATSADWPWPIARGAEVLLGVQKGDWAVAPQWQRQGVDGIRSRVKESHPWQKMTLAIGWPNEKVRALVRKRGRGWRLIGPLRRQVAPIRTERYLAEHGWPRPLASAVAAASDGLLGGWRRIRLGRRSRCAIEEVRRFDSGFDAVTQRCMMWQGFWCPHDAEFLNWRYLDHPTRSYVAFAARVGSEVGGYSVVGIDRERAWLMEFAAPEGGTLVARALIWHAIKAAHDAGCSHLSFFASAPWRQQRLFDTAGFFAPPSELILEPSGARQEEVLRGVTWQCLPGDTDFL